MVSKVKAGKQVQDPHYGCRDISILCAETAYNLFPFTTPIQETSSSLSTWVAYMLYRTALPNQVVFHALHLLHRISKSFHTALTISSMTHLHERLLLSSLVLATAYNDDCAFTNSSWKIAAQDYFTVAEIDEMEMEFLLRLGFRLRQEGEDLRSIIQEDEAKWLEAMRLQEQKLEQSGWSSGKHGGDTKVLIYEEGGENIERTQLGGRKGCLDDLRELHPSYSN
ncbi:hypothetical protein BT69DRAFT_1328002 [Atractiella rhizophila]|nr:hypothetical protein BT69DRAFT_1328002 [Atractiella rhizophila]